MASPEAQHQAHMAPSLSDQALTTGIWAARKGDKPLARRLLLKATELDPAREEAWLWLAGVAETPQEAHTYLQTALALNPYSQQARQGLRWIEGQLPPGSAGWLCPLCAQPLSAGERQCPVCGYLQPDQEGTALPGSQMRTPATGELSPGFVLSVEQAEAIDAMLDRMVYESDARCIILADVTGQLISERGQTGRVNTQVLSALAAGELAATNEMARLVGERARFRLLLHEGEEQSVYLSDVGEQWILVIVFDVNTPIGLVRLILKQAVEQLKPVIAQLERGDDRQQVNVALGNDFAQLLKTELDSSLS